MERLPQELLDQITAALIDKKTVRSLSIGCVAINHDNELCDEWNTFIHADLVNCVATDRCRHPERKYPTITNLHCEDAKELRALRLVSRSFLTSVQRLLRHYQVLAVDLDRSTNLRDAFNLVQCSGLPAPTLQIIAGEQYTIPARRFHEYNYDNEDDERQILGNHTDEKDKLYEPHDTEDPWPCSYLCALPKPTADKPNDTVPDEKKQMLSDLLQACQQGGTQGGFDGSRDRESPLTSLAVTFPVATSHFDTYDEHSVSFWDLGAVDGILGALRAELFDIEAPFISPGREINVERVGISDNLVDLRLEIPCTRHFSVLFPSTSQRTNPSQFDDATDHKPLPLLFPSLRHLLIHITDSSGPSGNSGYVGTEYAYNDLDHDAIDGTMTIATSGYPPSNLQLLYPNREHQDDMWRFIASCQTIGSLCVQASHFLGLDRLVRIVKQQKAIKGRGDANSEHDSSSDHSLTRRDWTMTGLKHLSLARIHIDTESLIYLIKPSVELSHDYCDDEDPASPSPIRRLNLDNVKIYAQSPSDLTLAVPPRGWDRLFTFLANRRACPEFEFLGLRNLTYFSDHPNYGHVGRPNEDVADMWTESDEDWNALRELAETGRGNIHDERNIGRDEDVGERRDLWIQGVDWEITTAGGFSEYIRDMGMGLC